MFTKNTIMKILSGIEDPELKAPLTELDTIKSVDIDGNNVTIGLSLTSSGCPMKEKIVDDINRQVKGIDGVKSVKVNLDVMTDEQKENLKKKLAQRQTSSTNTPTIHKFAKRFIAVASGKGGVGKSTVTTNLAAALARLGYKIGLLDADVYGFSIPHMMGVAGQPTVVDEKIVPIKKGDNLQIISMGFFVNEDEPVIWRGPLLHKAINQFISDVMWDQLDFLFLDLPPGTGDVTLTISQAIPNAELLVVTTPQATATHVAGRVAKLAEKTNLEVIGVIENMSYFDNNGEKEYIFGKDGGKNLADKLGVTFLGEIPLMTSMREGSDNGKPVATDGNDEQIALFERMARIIDQIHH